MREIIGVIIAVSLLIPSFGCGKEKSTGKKAPSQKVAQAEVAEKETETKSEKITAEVYSYDSKGRRDPFLSLIKITKSQPSKRKGASPFESYDITDFTLLAIAWDKDRHYAHIMLPDRKTYTITEGMTLGLRGGKVQKISRDTVIISELVEDYRGQMQPRDSILKLHRGEEE
jgi:Tfp pilus assembly protein PilP